MVLLPGATQKWRAELLGGILGFDVAWMFLKSFWDFGASGRYWQALGFGRGDVEWWYSDSVHVWTFG